ncbi:MAG: hypothetical protein RL011_2375 [Pseudomonadota bacterium]|jgi:mevalonate kinase
MSTILQASVSVPGKVMIAGEYSALTGAPATAAALDLKLTATATALGANSIGGCRVSSDLWSQSHTVADGSSPEDFPATPLLATVANAMTLFGVSDIELKVSSELSVEYGIGSSSALRLAVLAAFSDIARQKGSLEPLEADELAEIARSALSLQRAAQRQASGYDIATQWLGGIVVSQTSPDVQSWPLALQRLAGDNISRLASFAHVLVGGKGAPTAPAIGTTSSWLSQGERRNQLDEINTAINTALWSTLEADTELDPDQLTCFRDLVNGTRRHRQLFAEAPGFPSGLFERAAQIPGWEERWAMKTTGAGGEDAVLIFGSREDAAKVADAVAPLGWHLLTAGFSEIGLRLERTIMREEA